MSYKLAGPAAMESPYIPSSGSEKSADSYPGEIIREETPVQPVAYNPTFGEYINHGSQYAQADHSTSRGVSDVDFDDKTGTAYASLNEFQDRRVAAAAKMNGGTHSMGNDFASVPNNKLEERIWRNVRCMLVVLVVLIVFTLVISLIAVGFAVYNFLNTYDNGRLLPQGTVAPIADTTADPNVGSDAPSYQQLLAQIEELEANLSRLSNRHEGRSMEYENRFEELHAVVQNYSVEAMTAVPDQVPLYVNCSSQEMSTCSLVASPLASSAPSYAGCETGPVELNMPGLKIINMYCSVANDEETNPVIATLNVFGGAASCACFVLGLHDPLPQGGFDCHLTMETCPLVYNLTSPTLF